MESGEDMTGVVRTGSKAEKEALLNVLNDHELILNHFGVQSILRILSYYQSSTVERA